jgi:hypothetical protein
VSGALSALDPEVRCGFLRDALAHAPVADAARALDMLCLDAEQASERAREVLVSLVLVLIDPQAEPLVQLLREESAGASLLALGRLLRRPLPRGDRHEPPPDKGVPDYGKGRPLTLGERKSLARRPDRAAFDRLLHDPHPDVIHNLLRNPRLTEDDVIRLASMRPARADVLAELARHPRWSARPRVRLSIVLNPACPPEIAIPMVGLLVRHELRLVIEVTEGNPAVRAVAHELLVRRPPSLDDEPGDGGKLQ